MARYGFRFEPPRGWEFVPPTPGSANVVGQWSPSGDDRSVSAGAGKLLYPRCVMLVFDRRPREAGPALSEGERVRDLVREGDRVASLREWMERRSQPFIGEDFELVAEESLALEGLEGARLLEYRGTSHALVGGQGRAPSVALVGLYPLEADLEVALCFNAPARDSLWRRWERELRRVLGTFEPADLLVDPLELEGLSLRERRRVELTAQVRSQPGWSLSETQHHFVLSSSEDEAFLGELRGRLELLHAAFREAFPAAPARAALALRRERRRALLGEPPLDPARAPDPLEAARCSVVRVFKDRGQYFAYGAPTGSAGYWFALEEELVLYDDLARGGRERTWRVLAHEAFHQYIHHHSGNLEPAPWFDEGHAEFFAGHDVTRHGLVLEANREQRLAVRQQVQEGRLAPLERLLRWSRGELYGGNALGLTQAEGYAQSWSLVWFLRTGERTSRSWKPEWGRILDRYTATLIETADRTRALEAALEAVDLSELEAAWLASVEED